MYSIETGHSSKEDEVRSGLRNYSKRWHHESVGTTEYVHLCPVCSMDIAWSSPSLAGACFKAPPHRFGTIDKKPYKYLHNLM